MLRKLSKYVSQGRSDISFLPVNELSPLEIWFTAAFSHFSGILVSILWLNRSISKLSFYLKLSKQRFGKVLNGKIENLRVLDISTFADVSIIFKARFGEITAFFLIFRLK